MSSSSRVLGRGTGRVHRADDASDGSSAPSPGTHRSSSVVLRGRPQPVTRGGQARYAGVVATASAVRAFPDDTTPGADGAPELVTELEELLAAAEQRGHDRGRTEAEAELAAAVAAAGAVAAELEALAPRETKVVAEAVVVLALAIARRILDTHVRLDPTVLVATLERAVSVINGAPEARVMLHPDAVEPVRAAWEAVHGRGYLDKRWVFLGDASLPPGGCVVRYEHGHVDASLEGQLEEIGVALDAVIPGLLLSEEEGSW